MIRFTWAQFRIQAAVAFGALAVVGIVLALTGPQLAHLYQTSGIATCKSHGDCATLTSAFLSHYRLLQQLGIVLIVVPGVIGVFWGAPLVSRELETGTNRLAWTQSISRTRWLAVKLGVVGLASMTIAGLLSLMVTLWSAPIDQANLNNQFAVFDHRGIVPIGYAAFAFAFGVAAGAVIRRTLPAMAATVVAFTAARMAMTSWVRARLTTPASGTGTFTLPSGSGSLNLSQSVGKPSDWILSGHVVDPNGQTVGTFVGSNIQIGVSRSACPGGPANLSACVAKYRSIVTYQPASRFWIFQWYEMAIFLGLALIMVGFCFWWVRRRLG